MADDIKIFYGLSWIIESGGPPENELSYRFSSRPNQSEYFWLANIMRELVPKIDSYDAKKKDPFGAIYKDIYIIASHPRPYSERQLDCAKSDILVVAPSDKIEEANRIFEREIAIAKAEKLHVQEYVKKILAPIDELAKEGVIDGLLGRGSYFDPNGLPVPRDDIDFILVARTEKTQEEIEKIKNALRKIDGNVELLVKKVEKLKDGYAPPDYSFMLFDANRAKASRGPMYEKYILQHSEAIGLPSIKKEESQKAGEFLSELITATVKSKVPLK